VWYGLIIFIFRTFHPFSSTSNYIYLFPTGTPFSLYISSLCPIVPISSARKVKQRNYDRPLPASWVYTCPVSKVQKVQSTEWRISRRFLSLRTTIRSISLSLSLLELSKNIPPIYTVRTRFSALLVVIVTTRHRRYRYRISKFPEFPPDSISRNNTSSRPFSVSFSFSQVFIYLSFLIWT